MSEPCPQVVDVSDRAVSARSVASRPVAARPAPRVNRAIDLASAYSWRMIVIAVVVLGALWLIRQMWVVFVAAIIALLLTRVLAPPGLWLRDRGVPRALSALAVLLGGLLLLVAAGALIVPPAADEFSQLGSTVDEAIDDVETWLVEDAPGDLSRSQLNDFRDQAQERITQWARRSGGALVTGAILALEIAAAVLLAIITTFFLVKDGERFQRAALRVVPEGGRDTARAMAARAWATLGAYLKGAAMLGIVEAVIIGVTLWIVGANLVVPVMVLTVLGAFIPFVGAILAAVIAVLVALATAGFGAAAIVAIVALIMQQLDNDLLAPVIYGKALQLHPLTVLFAITAAGALFGPVGAVLAVPLTAVVVNVISEYRSRPEASHDDDGATAEAPA